MDEIEFEALLLSLIEARGMTGKIANELVNGTDNSDFLGWYDEEDFHRHQVCASFHLLGQEVLLHCSPMVALIVSEELVNVRNRVLMAMKEAPIGQ